MNPDVEYILRIILRARDEMAAVLAKAKTELRGFVSQSNTAEQSVNKLSNRIGGLNTRLTALQNRLDETQGRLRNWGNNQERLEGITRSLVPSIERQERSTQRLGRSTRDVDRDSKGLVSTLNNLANRIASTGDNVASLDNRLRGMAVLGVLVFASQLNSALIGLGGTLVSVGGSAAMAGGAIGGGLVAGIAQALPAIGLLAGALFRVNQVFDAVGKLQDVNLQKFGRTDAAAKRTADSSNTLANAQDSLVESQKRVGDANDQVAESQKALTEARQQARREIEDLALAERGAFLSEQEAQRRLTEAQRSGNIGELAQLRLDVDEARVRRQRAVQDANEAQRQGVGRRPVVVDARRQLQDAKQGVQEAEQAVVKSQRAVEQARRGAQTAAADTFAAGNALQFMLQQMSPAERRLYEASRRILRTFNTDFRGVTDTIVDSFARGVNGANRLLQRPDVLRTAQRLSNQLARQFDRIFDSFTSDRQVKQFERISDAGRKNLKPLGDIAIDIGHIFANIAEEAGPSLHQFVLFVRELVQDFRRLTGDQGKMENFFESGEKHLEAWVRLALSVVNLFAALVGGSAGSGLRTITDATRLINGWARDLRDNGEQTAKFFEDARKATYALATVVGAIGEGMFALFNPERVERFAHLLTEIVIPSIVQALDILGKLTDALVFVLDIPIVGDVAKWAVTFLLVAKAVTGLSGAFAEMLNLTSHFVQLTRLEGIFGRLGALIGLGAGGGLRGAFTGLGASIRTAFSVRSFAPLLDFLRGLPGRIRGARVAASAPQVGGAVVDPRRGPQATAGAGIDPRRGPQAPAVVATPRGRVGEAGRSTIGAVRGIGGAIGLTVGSIIATQIITDAFTSKDSFSQREQRLTPGQQRAAGNIRGRADTALESLFGAQPRSLSEAIAPGIGDRLNPRNIFGGLDLAEADRISTKLVGIEGKIRKLSKAGNEPGIRRIADNLRKMGDELGGSRQALLDKFADGLERVARQAGRLNTAFGRKLSFDRDDIRNPFWVNNFARSLERLRTSGIDSIGDLRTKLSSNIADIRRAFKEGSEGANDAMVINFGAGTRALIKAMDNGKISVKDGMAEINRITDRQMRFVKNHMADLSDDGRAALSRNFALARNAVRARMDETGDATGEGMRRIRRLLATELEAYGIDPKEARRISKRGGSIDDAFREAGHAGGGPIWLGNRGERGADGSAGLIRGHPVGRGELVIANKPQAVAIDAALHSQFGFGIQDLPRKIRGAHAGQLGSGFAEGGSLFDGHPSNVAPGIVTLLRIMQKRWPGLSVSSTTDHSLRTTSGNISDHSTGHAVDLSSGDYAYMNAAAQWVRTSGLYKQIKQGIHNPNLAIADGKIQTPPGQYAGHTWTEHLNHIHLAVAGALSAKRVRGRFATTMAGAVGEAVDLIGRKELRGTINRLREFGVPGEIGGAAVEAARRGANRRLSKIAGDVAPGGGTVLHGSGDVESIFAQVARRLSKSRVATLALGMAGYAESGMRDLPGGMDSSQGALQLLASTAQGLGVSPHDEKAIASLFLTRGYYGRGGANQLAAQGLPAHLVAQNVQGSAFSSGSNYAAQEGNARAWMKRYKLASGGLIPGLRGFAAGGEVDGNKKGAGKLILAHVGEWVLSDRHQEVLARALGLTKDAIAKLLGLEVGGEPVDEGGGRRRSRGGGGSSALVGDSLTHGMQLYARGRLGGGVHINARDGRPPGEAAGVLLGSLLRRGDDTVGFDVGSNGSIGDLGSAIDRVKRRIGNRSLVMATVAGAIAGASAKNNIIRNRADRVVPWGAEAGHWVGADGVHPGPAGYRKRASMWSRGLRGFASGGIVGAAGGLEFTSGTLNRPRSTAEFGGMTLPNLPQTSFIGPQEQIQWRFVDFIRIELKQITKDFGDYLKFMRRGTKAVLDTVRNTRADNAEIDALTNQIERLKKGDENERQKRQIRQATTRLHSLQGRQDEAWKLYELHLEGLTRDGGIIDQQVQALQAFAENLALRTLSRTFQTFGRGQVGRVLTDEQVSNRNLRDLRTRLPRERTFLRRLQSEEGDVRDVTIAEQRTADRASRNADNIQKRIKRLQRGEEDKEQKSRIKSLQDRLADARDDAQKFQKRADTSRTGLTGVRNRLLAQQQLVAELLQSIWEAQVEAQQKIVDRINRNAEVANRFVEGVQRVAELTGREDLFHAAASGGRSVMQNQIQQLKTRLFTARGMGANDLADQIEDQIAELQTAIADSIQQEIQDAVERVNQRAQRRLGRLDLFERMAAATGVVGLQGASTVFGQTANRGQVFQQRGQVLQQQRSELQRLVFSAGAAGNLQLVQDLTDQLAELEVAIKENSAAYFQARVEDVNNRANFNLNINDLNRQIIDLTGQISGQVNQTELLRLAQDRGNILTQQGIALQALLVEAQAAGNQQEINDLTAALLENQIAVLQNTQAVKELSGATNEPQTFSSSSWQWFRQALFTGLGQPLPQYQVPGAASGAMITNTGLLMGHTGEMIKPAGLSRPQWDRSYESGNTFNFDITEQPTETDYEFLGETIARKVKTAGV